MPSVGFLHPIQRSQGVSTPYAMCFAPAGPSQTHPAGTKFPKNHGPFGLWGPNSKTSVFGDFRAREILNGAKSGTVRAFFESYSGRKPLWGPTPFVFFAGVPPLAQKTL